MAEYKLVFGTKDGKSIQKEIKTDFFKNKRIGDKLNGSDFGYDGYEFELTGRIRQVRIPYEKRNPGTPQKGANFRWTRV